MPNGCCVDLRPPTTRLVTESRGLDTGYPCESTGDGLEAKWCARSRTVKIRSQGAGMLFQNIQKAMPSTVCHASGLRERLLAARTTTTSGCYFTLADDRGCCYQKRLLRRAVKCMPCLYACLEPCAKAGPGRRRCMALYALVCFLFPPSRSLAIVVGAKTLSESSKGDVVTSDCGGFSVALAWPKSGT